MMRLAWVPYVVVGPIVLIVACSSDGDGGGGSSSGATSSSSSGNIGGGSSSGGASSSSGGAGSKLAVYATAICEKVEKCQPGVFAQNWASKAECVEDVEASNSAGLTALPGMRVSEEQIGACAARIASSSCSFGLGDLAECALTGALGAGVACYDGRQCETGRCKRAALSDDCGSCAAFEAEGGSCLEDGDCAFGLTCDGGECAKLVAKGEACDVDGRRCDAGLVCANGECAEPVEKDGACTASGNECRRSLVCSGNVCKDVHVKVAALGEKCDASTRCRKSSCRGAPGRETCVAYAAMGGACGSEMDGPPGCDDDSFCVENGTCEGNTYPACK